MSTTLSGHLIEYRTHRYECLRCGARLMSMMQFNGRECPGPRQQEVTAPIAPEGITPDGARYAAHLIRKRSKGDRFHPRRPETAAAMLAAADWLDQFATRPLPPEGSAR